MIQYNWNKQKLFSQNGNKSRIVSKLTRLNLK